MSGVTTRPQFISRSFQGLVQEFLNQPINEKKVLILDAPTGSGKTYSFRNIPNGNSLSFMIMPNNYLLEEKFIEFSHDDMVGPGKVKILNKEHINKFLDDYNLTHTPANQIDAISSIISNSRLVLTNPTILFFIMYNYYWGKVHKVGSHIADILHSNLTNLIFDEFHVYSHDQRNRIYALNAFLNKNVKFVYTSATLPQSTEKVLSKLLGHEYVEVLKVSDLEDDNMTLIRGRINANILKGKICEIADELIPKLSDGNWILILNTIKEIDCIYKKILQYGISKDDVVRLSRFHNPNLEQRRSFLEGKKKIVISSNIIEQGINPSKKYLNYIIEPGFYYYNFQQRIGRVGRGTDKESNVIIPVGNIHIDILESHELEFTEFIDKISENMPKDMKMNPEPRDIGFYVANYLDFLEGQISEDVIRRIFMDLPSWTDLEKSISLFHYLEKFTLDINKNCTLSNNDEIRKWWTLYNLTFRDFIPKETNIELIDMDRTNLIPDDENYIDTIYSKTFVYKNMQIIDNSYGKIKVSGFLEEKNLDFKVKVHNLPFKDNILIFSDIENKERRQILRSLESYGNQFKFDCKNGKQIIGLIYDFLYSTAWEERLIIDVYDE